MAYQQRGGGQGRRFQGPGRQVDQQLYQKCMQLGVSYPPNPPKVYQTAMSLKNSGQQYLNDNQLRYALDNYTHALRLTELIPHKEFREEAIKILCNRSLVFLKMKLYKDAENDAKSALTIGPNFLKGYWRAYQATKGSPHGPQKSLPYVSMGLKVAVRGEGTTQDIISFLTELCLVVPNVANLPMTDPMLDDLEILDISERQIWTRTLQALLTNKNWASLRMLVLGNSGPVCCLRGFCRDFNFSGFDVSELLELSYVDLKIWGIPLLEKLLEQGAPVEKIGKRFEMPALHVGVDRAIKVDSVRLLEAILQCYIDAPNAKNVRNGKGQTSLHLAVVSSKAGQPIIEEIVGALLKHGCDPGLTDKEGKRPLDFVMQGTNLFMLLKKATKSVADLRKDLDALRVKGNQALKRGDTWEALKMYDQALKVSEKSKDLYKDAAVLYSNKANTYYTMGDLESALSNAIAAVSCDPTYPKGHVWKGKVLSQMRVNPDAFMAYIEGCLQTDSSMDDRAYLLTEAMMKLPDSESLRVDCYGELKRIQGTDIWSLTLQKLSANSQWKCIIYLVLGPKLDHKPFKNCPSLNDINKVSSGLAWPYIKDIDLATVFDYLRWTECTQADCYWLDVLLLSVYLRVSRAAFNKIAENSHDNYLHSIARFALFTDRTFLLETILRQPLAGLSGLFMNGIGDSVFHTITKIRPLPTEKVLLKIAQMFMEKGFITSTKDPYGRLAVDYLDTKYSGKVFDLFLKKFVPFSWDEVNRLKEKGNQKYKSGDVQEAVEWYTKAIDLIQSQHQNTIRGPEHRDVSSKLYGNRAEGYLKLGQFGCALDDAKTSLNYNGHWYKAHLRVAKAQKGLKRMENALNAYINAYKEVPPTDDKVQIEILSDMIVIGQHMPNNTFDMKIKNTFPHGHGHVWMKTSYELIRKDEWDRAYTAYLNFVVAMSKNPHITYSLAPICNLDKMRTHKWSVDLIRRLIDLGADRRTLTLNKGDTYLHASVRISLLVVKDWKFLDWLIKKYKEVNLLDQDGNTALHTACREKMHSLEIQNSVVKALLQANIDANVMNRHGQLAIDLLPGYSTETAEKIRMAMYRGKTQQRSAVTLQRPKPQVKEPSPPVQPKKILKHSCEECTEYLKEARTFLIEDQVFEAYTRLREMFEQPHKGKVHEDIVRQAVNAIVSKLGDKTVPEIPSSLTAIPKEFYQQVVDGLMVKKKWQQVNSVVRKYRLVKGQDQLKGFAQDQSIVPVIVDPSLKETEDEQRQIIINMLNSGAFMGTDRGQKALKHAKELERYKLVGDLIKRGADASHFSLTSGDTPIHAVVKMVLEKEKDIQLLEFVFDQFEKNPREFPHLNPWQQNKNGDCLFHLVAKGKHNNHVVKVTEFLCKRKLSAAYYNKEGKLPKAYITKQNDRRLQFIHLASKVDPVNQQKYKKGGGNNGDETSENAEEEEDELHDFPRRGEDHNMEESVVEKGKKFESEKELLKKRVEELIKNLPDFKSAKPIGQDDLPDMTDKINQGKAVTDKINQDKAVTDKIDQAKAMTDKIDQAKVVTDKIDQAKEVTDKIDQDKAVADKIDQSKEDGRRDGEGVDTVKTLAKETHKTLMKDGVCVSNETMKDGVCVSDETMNDGVCVSDETMKDGVSVSDETMNDGVCVSDETMNDGVCVSDETMKDGVCVSDETMKEDHKLGGGGKTEDIKIEPQTVGESNTHSNTEILEKQLETVGENNDHSITETVKNISHGDCKSVVNETVTVAEIDISEPMKLSDETNSGGEQNVMSSEPGPVIERNGQSELEDNCVEGDESEDDEEDEGTEEFDAKVFDNLEWEVECTQEVWKTLRDKHVLPSLKNRIIKRIQLLASGNWQPVLCKKLRNVPKTLDLFEAKFSKGSRIIWEKAIAFSPRCSESAERRLQLDTTNETRQAVRGGRIYSEIIRVWEIVFDHDKIHRSVERIKKSHHRGEECIIQKNLRGIKSDTSQLTLTLGSRIYPKMFAENDVSMERIMEQQEELQQYFPPASANETEYHILKFYSFSSTLVSHVLQNIDTKVDFPFRVTDLEHAIIHLSSKSPILLLGRSGTGKTTCCLYRLWSQFLAYWSKAKEADAPLLPRCIEFVHTETPEAGNQGDESDNNDEEVEGEASGPAGQSELMSSGSDPNDQPDHYDHIHQVFITKNLVLCSEVQKNFHELSHADDLMREHVEHENDALPNRLQDVGDYAFPLFLTSRQLLLMLDASIGQPYFFDRKEDGSLKADIAGWSEDGPLHVLALLEEESDSEDEDWNQFDENEEAGEETETLQATARKNKVDPRREITYQVFVEEVWPKISKKLSYHPSLVWTEIMSFIKGSFEALSQTNGYLPLDEYLKLGKKRAPNFSAEREHIHRFFKRYEHFKKQHHLFDETDLVYNIYGRLRHLNNRPWLIHQVYVDETQDFTQAELCLLIRMCQNPNDMFLTGDTAQSIMRGIAFRFSDLRSLFYHAKQSMQAMGKTSAVEVPKKVYQLTHNYRSHAGILSLASSILELMVEFFPESFDRLQRDQGLFTGPQPILLESCSFGDLAVLLRGNKRKTSHIEFGAHQAILVVNEAARDAIPEELRLGLVLTIYESKGLEFDDVLLYNFFKDSQASKEWRVVTEYLERLLAMRGEKSGEKITHVDNLVEIDEDVLIQSGKPRPGRPRPLDFDPNLHKVLNSELKHLYTALTRARVNVWIFDGDDENRAPMFEYFRARKLVKSITVTEINEESLAETVFAEKSSAEDWNRQGEDFMRHDLYGIAAKCFGIAGDTDRQKVALAHEQAVKAARLKDKPREMRQEFIKAAEKYLHCNKPAKAAICLQNARERELAAELFEKLGQYERAADIYRKLHRPIASSRCYEQQGIFNKAVEVLFENESYSMAIDTLKRYEMLVKELAQRHAPIPGALIAYKPADYFTVEKLSHTAAEKAFSSGNTERMLTAIESFSKLTDRVEFLEKRGLIKQAAGILKDNDEPKEASRMLLEHGFTLEATEIARASHDQATLGHCILVSCRVVMATRKEESNQPESTFDIKGVLKTIAEGIELLEVCKHNDQFGEMRLLMAELTRNPGDVRLAWRAFLTSKPKQNDLGLVECGNWLIHHGHLDKKDHLLRLVESVGHTFSVCVVLSKPNEAMNFDKVAKYLQLYGLHIFSQTELKFYPEQQPLCVEILKSQKMNVERGRRSFCTINKEEAYTAITCFLLKRAYQWMETIWTSLLKLRDRNRLCSFYSAGLTCPDVDNVDNKCHQLHTPMTDANMKEVINVDLLLVELEGEIQNGCVSLNRHSPPPVKELVRRFTEEGERDQSEKYNACIALFDDLVPSGGHPVFINENSGELIWYLQKNTKVQYHLRDYLVEQWRIRRKSTEKASTCRIARETQIVFLFEFGYHLFGMDKRCRIEPSPRSCLERFERDIDEEASLNYKRFNYYTLVTYRSGNKLYVESIAKRFMDAYDYISSNPNPYEAVFKFSKFVTLQRKRVDISQLPDLNHYCMWLEFFLTIAIILTAKLKTREFPDFFFILPSNYFALVKFIEATFPNPTLARVITSIDKWQPSSPKHYQEYITRLQDRLKYISFGICGFNHNISILKKALERSHGEPHFYAIAERIIVLHMVLVLNIGKTLPVECETCLMKSLIGITVPPDGPDRLQRLDIYIKQKVKGIADVAQLLDSLLKTRQMGEELLVCTWNRTTRHKIDTTKLEDEKLFRPTFFNPKTESAMRNLEPIDNIDDEGSFVEEELTEAEIQRSVEEKQRQDIKDKKNQAAVRITNFFRSIVNKRKSKQSLLQRKRERLHDDFGLLESVKVTDTFCGFCGVDFADMVKKTKSLEQSVVVGTQSVMNTKDGGTYDPPGGIMGSTPVSPEPNSGPQYRREDTGSGSGFFNMPDESGDTGLDENSAILSPLSPEVAAHGDNTGFIWQRSVSNDARIDRQTVLKQIKQAHQKDGTHMTKQAEFSMFEKKCRTKILPKISTIREFFEKDEYHMGDPEYVQNNYDVVKMEIERMRDNTLPKIETEILKVFTTRQWSSIGEIEQMVTELGTDFEIVMPYVEEVSEKIKKQEEARQARATSVPTNPRHRVEFGQEDNYGYDDDEEDVQEVIQDQPKKNKVFYNKNYGRRHRKGPR